MTAYNALTYNNLTEAEHTAMAHQTNTLPQTSRPEILDFEVTAHGAGFLWETFDAQTAAIIASGSNHTKALATLAALGIIADRKPSWRFVVKSADAVVIRLQDGAGGGVWYPLPLTTAADAAHVYAYVNALPSTAGRPVEVLDLETL